MAGKRYSIRGPLYDKTFAIFDDVLKEDLRVDGDYFITFEDKRKAGAIAMILNAYEAKIRKVKYFLIGCRKEL